MQLTNESVLNWIGIATGGASLLYGFWRFVLRPLVRWIKDLRRHSIELSHALPDILGLSRDSRSAGISLERAFHKLAEDNEWNERRYVVLILNYAISTFETDEHGHLMWASPAWCRLTGLDIEQAAKNGWLTAVHEDWRQIVRTEWEAAVRDEREFNMCYQLSNRQAIHVYAVRVSLHGKTLGYIGMVTPVADCAD